MPSFFIFKAGNKFITAVGHGIEVRDNFDNNTKVLYYGKDSSGNIVNIMINNVADIRTVTDFKYVYPIYMRDTLTTTNLDQMSKSVKEVVDAFIKTRQKTKTTPNRKKKPSKKSKKNSKKKKSKKGKKKII